MPDNLPTEPGYYWHRDVDEGSQEAFEWSVLCVEKARTGLFLKGTSDTPKEVGGEWGPRIPDPDETRETDEANKHSVQTAHNAICAELAERFMASIRANSKTPGAFQSIEDIVSLAYSYADAMLTERDKQP